MRPLRESLNVKATAFFMSPSRGRRLPQPESQNLQMVTLAVSFAFKKA